MDSYIFMYSYINTRIHGKYMKAWILQVLKTKNSYFSSTIGSISVSPIPYETGIDTDHLLLDEFA